MANISPFSLLKELLLLIFTVALAYVLFTVSHDLIHPFFDSPYYSRYSYEALFSRVGPTVLSIVLLSVLNILSQRFLHNSLGKKHVTFCIVSILVIGFFLTLGIFSMGKPVIYLYPSEPSDVHVRLVTSGVITVSDPQYPPDGWRVHAEPSGLIDGKYPYLFYEADVRTRIDEDTGWIVPEEDVVAWFGRTLPELGLTQEESRDFNDYWSQHLPESRYYKIIPLSPEKLDEMVRLDITPRPDTLIRVNLLIKPVDEPESMKEPVIERPERKGFTVAEWGVILG
ncbi:hypothetical protein ACFLRF_00045 [Candidatus Altiarchaeota archaeon]